MSGAPDHSSIPLVGEALDLLPQQWQGKPRITALVEAFVMRLAQVEFEFDNLKAQRQLDVAVGVQLDGMGQILGVARGSLDDATYRRALEAVVRLNISDGTADDIVSMILPMLGSQGPGLVEIIEWPPAEAEVLVGWPTTLAVALAALVGRGRAAGVRIVLRWRADTGAAEAPFGFAGVAGADGFDHGILSGAMDT